MSFRGMRGVLVAFAALLLSNGTAKAQSDDIQPLDQVLQIAQDQVTTLGLTADQLTFTMSMPAQWPDSSLGCPQPGMAYSQIVTPGWLLTFDIDDGASQAEVHTDGGSRAVVC